MSGLMVTAEEYPALCNWVSAFLRHDPHAGPEFVKDFEETIAQTGMGASARRGLAMAIGDCMQMVENWQPQTVAAFNAECVATGLPSLADIQFRFWKTIRAIQARGHIRTEKEYYALRGAVEMMTDAEASGVAWDMLRTFEEKLAPGAG